MMPKLRNNIPRHYVTNLQMESYPEFSRYPYSMLDNYGKNYHSNIQRRVVKMEIQFQIESDEDFIVIQEIKDKGIEYIANMGFDLEKFKFVMNQGYTNLPILLKHPDEDIRELAWILSKYFSQREKIMPDKIME
jgi:hypothetical protein